MEKGLYMSIRRFVREHRALSFFGVYWQVLFTHLPVDPDQGPTPLQFALAALGGSPSLFGVLLAYVANGAAGLRDMVARLGRWRVGPAWWAAALLLAPALNALAYLVYRWLGGQTAPLSLSMVPVALGAALLEELGWRGFALPALQARYRPLPAGLIVGLGWGLWHLRLNATVMASEQSLLANLLLPWGPLGMMAWSVLMVWIYNHSRQSLLLMVLFHFSLTGSFFVFGPPLSASDADWLRFDLISLAILWGGVLAVWAMGTGRLLKAERPASPA
jgi:membrane protease YdiL (CAAX protease family)